LKRSEDGERDADIDVIVVDASVIIKWFVQENQTEQALILRQDYLRGALSLACPDLMQYEVINALRYKPSLGEEGLKEVASLLEKYNFLSYSLLADNLAEPAIEVSLRYGLTIYDASYVALGILLDSIVYTADIKLVNQVSDEALVKSISTYSQRTVG
jgi:predicted nucleic acid-binding protein